ncbi:MAG: restriction modification system DNA specificity domain-containing protein [Chloroflexi bacterium OLB14]|nr:MAG: restriction modification system DNA specificity domain-containing protein [Chloroflexi bacterium OLB14]
MSFSTKYRLVKLNEVAAVTSDRVLPFDGLRAYIATADVQDGDIVGKTDITFEGRPSRADVLVKTEDVIFARMQNTQKVLQINAKYSDYVFSTGFAVCRPTKQILPDYLRYWFLSDYFNNLKDSYCTGSTQKAISNSGIEKLIIPLPSLETQRKIVLLLSDVEHIKKLRLQAEFRMKQFIPALFNKMFGNPAFNEKPMENAKDQRYWNSKNWKHSPTNRREFYGDEIEWIKSDNI